MKIKYNLRKRNDLSAVHALISFFVTALKQRFVVKNFDK